MQLIMVTLLSFCVWCAMIWCVKRSVHAVCAHSAFIHSFIHSSTLSLIGKWSKQRIQHHKPNTKRTNFFFFLWFYEFSSISFHFSCHWAHSRAHTHAHRSLPIYYTPPLLSDSECVCVCACVRTRCILRCNEYFSIQHSIGETEKQCEEAKTKQNRTVYSIDKK